MLHLLSPAGFVANGVYAGIKSKKAPDVGLLFAQNGPASAAAVFTTNKVCAAPVTIGKEHIRSGRLRGVVVNSGNANACTGEKGLQDAVRMCELTAMVPGCKSREILPSSTGIIGHLMPMEKIEKGIELAAQNLGDSADHADAFARAIMTTDLKKKTAEAKFKVDGKTVILAGVCKGSGMIGPRMALPHATMLAYLTTDAHIESSLLKKLLGASADRSFNCVTVDDHTSTNDTAVILASGLSNAKIIREAALSKFTDALNEVCQSLAYQIAADGEGATKVVAIEVKNAANPADANIMARAIANSNLVKCAMHGNDPNWGRIVSAAGLTPAKFHPEKTVLKLAGTTVFSKGRPVPFDAKKVSKAMNAPEVKIILDCNLGKSAAKCWTCDLSRDYIRINADYHT
jgi:glutamate N-acetyltransferase / amino-acid N-acetyltransferase